MDSMNFLVVTNSYGRTLDLVERSLHASLKQLGKNDRLLFIDQNQNPLKLSQEIASHPSIKVLSRQVRGVSSARNGLLEEKWTNEYEWIVFCDDDGYFSENYMETLRLIINKNQNLEIIAGSILNSDGTGFYSPRHKIGGSLKNFRNHKLLMGSNFAVKRKTFQSLGGFDSSFGTGAYWGSGEESDFCINAYFKKIPMEYFRELSIYHLPPRSGPLRDEITKAWKYAIGKGALVYKWMIKNKNPIVALEFSEMLVVPWIQFIFYGIKFDKKFIIFPAVFVGRLVGFFKASIKL